MGSERDMNGPWWERVSGRSLDVTSFLLVLIVACFFAARWTSQLDIRLYDETTYLERGLNVGSGLPSADMAPAYALWYRALSMFTSDRTTLYFLNYGITLVLLPVMTFLLLRAWDTARSASSIASLYVLFTAMNVFNWPRVSIMAMVILMTGCIIAARAKDRDRAYAAGILAAALAVFVRPEFFLSVILLCALWSWKLLKNGSWRERRVWPFLVLVGAGILGLLLLFGDPLANGRGMIAFGQHYAYNWEEANRSGMDPWTSWEQIIAQDLGGAESVGEALIASPRNFMGHVIRNVELALPAVGAQLLPYWSRPMWYGLLCLAALFIGLLFLGSKKGMVQKGSTFRLELMLALCVPPLLSVVVIHPRAHYLVVLLVFGLLVLVARAFPDGSIRTTPKGLRIAPLALLLVLFLLPRTRPVGPVDRPVLNTIQRINSLPLNGTITMLDADGGYSVYMNAATQRVTAQDKATGFNSFIRAQALDLIVATPRLKQDHRYKQDAEWQQFIAGGHAPLFRVEPVQGTDVELYIAERVLGKGSP